jgi:hypothetical protein
MDSIEYNYYTVFEVVKKSKHRSRGVRQIFAQFCNFGYRNMIKNHIFKEKGNFIDHRQASYTRRLVHNHVHIADILSRHWFINASSYFCIDIDYDVKTIKYCYDYIHIYVLGYIWRFDVIDMTS